MFIFVAGRHYIAGSALTHRWRGPTKSASCPILCGEKGSIRNASAMLRMRDALTKSSGSVLVIQQEFANPAVDANMHTFISTPSPMIWAATTSIRQTSKLSVKQESILAFYSARPRSQGHGCLPPTVFLTDDGLPNSRHQDLWKIAALYPCPGSCHTVNKAGRGPPSLWTSESVEELPQNTYKICADWILELLAVPQC